MSWCERAHMYVWSTCVCDGMPGQAGQNQVEGSLRVGTDKIQAIHTEWSVPKDKGYGNNVHLDLHISKLRVGVKHLQSSLHLVIPTLFTPPQIHTETEQNLYATEPKGLSVSCQWGCYLTSPKAVHLLLSGHCCYIKCLPEGGQFTEGEKASQIDLPT